MPGLSPTDFPAITGDYGDYSVFNYMHFTQATSLSGTVKGQVALLHTVTVNVVAAAGSTLTLTDGNGGPTIAIIDLTKQVPYTYDVKANNGLFYVLNQAPTGVSATVAFA